MITMLGSRRRLCDGLTRRETLKAGALSLLGGAFNLPSLLAAEEKRGPGTRPGKARSVILLYLLGGAPTQDMFDLKPNAPDRIRGEFKPVASNVSGIQICEHLPLTARWMHRAALVRSVNHKAGCHNPLASYTGYEVALPDITSTKDTYPPSMGSVCEYLRKPQDDLPAYLYLPNYAGAGNAGGVVRYPGPYAGFLGKRYDPLFSEFNPAIVRKIKGTSVLGGEPFLARNTRLAEGITLDALQTREGLLQQFNRQQRRLESDRALDDVTRMQQRALSLLTSTKLKSAFDLSKVDPRLRDQYDRTLFGASALIGRRLVEAGVRFVNVTWDFPGDNSWDTHAANFAWLRGALPSLDATYSTLLQDLEGLGLLDETLVVLMSDMGRTPQVNAAAGRDHWTYCYTVVFAGAGIRGGTVYGASDAHAAYVKDRPVSTGDICATIYYCLGIDPEMPVHDRGGRPVPVAHGGRPIREILV
ncbi:MAG: DUF1501 domain-containing protein [Planctomycetes bacterium]|nr:DUF1501 domain-containing protein [Planctomycetota bacterium]